MSDQQILALYHRLSYTHQQEVQNFLEFLLSKQTVSEPPNYVSSERRGALGSLQGKVWMAPDFDAPLDDFREYM